MSKAFVPTLAQPGVITANDLREGHNVWLIAENPDFAPIEIDLRQQELHIEGLSVGILRR